MNLSELMRTRRSVRQYNQEQIPEDALNLILEAGLLSPSSRTIRPWEFIVVQDREMLEKLSLCKPGVANTISQAAAVIAVVGDETRSDVWIEDCSIAMTMMHLMAENLGIGSCWIQGRLRTTPEGLDTESYVRDLLNFPYHYRLQALLSLGIPAQHPRAHTPEELDYTKVHWERFDA